MCLVFFIELLCFVMGVKLAPKATLSIRVLLMWISLLFVQFRSSLTICPFLSHYYSLIHSFDHPFSALFVELQMYTVWTTVWKLFIEHISLRIVQKRNYPLFWHFPGHVIEFRGMSTCSRKNAWKNTISSYNLYYYYSCFECVWA